MPHTTPTTRETKQQATALRVERSAVRLVLQHGFDHVTVGMICDASEISQRTFFNYFKTKGAAVIGADVPQVDESQARQFIASDSDLLAELLTLMMSMAANLNFDEKLMTDRIIVFGQNPELLHKQMERMIRVTLEVTELVYLRLKRTAGAAATDGAVDEQDLRDQAELLTNAIMGVLRFVASRWIPTPDAAAATGPSDLADAGARPAPSRDKVLQQALALLRRTLRTA